MYYKLKNKREKRKAQKFGFVKFMYIPNRKREIISLLCIQEKKSFDLL